MTYDAKDARQLRKERGSILAKITGETALIDGEIDIHKSKFALITGHIGTRTALATTGVDIGSGATTTYYGAFMAPVDISLVKMHYIVNEAYVKDTSDAKVEVYDNAGTPVKRFGRTMAAAGEAAGSTQAISPETGVSALAAGTRLDLKITGTGSSSGTGYLDIYIEYTENHA